MSLKLVELQVALPKTVDAGKIAGEQQHQNVVAQSQAAAETEKERLRMKASIQHANEGARTKREQDQPGSPPKKPQPHPFKGKRVDYSG